MKIKVQREDIFIPEYNKNLELKKEKQISMRVRYLSSAEYNETMVIGPTGKIQQDATMLIEKSIVEIKNLSIEDEDGGVVELVTSEEFLNAPALTTLFYEVYTFLAEMNKRLNLKNLESPTDG